MLSDDADRTAEPLGAHPVVGGVRFAVASKHADRVELCLFDRPDAAAPSQIVDLERAGLRRPGLRRPGLQGTESQGTESQGTESQGTESQGTESQGTELRGRPGDIWSAVVDVAPGQLYGYRVTGPHQPKEGHRFNPSKLLVDPWARAITGEPRTDRSLFGFKAAGWPNESYEHDSSDLTFDSRESAAFMPKCVVVDPTFDWQGDRSPRTPWSETVLYECHVRGLTQRHPDLDEALRGTYLGLASEPILEHLIRLGVTAVELLPIHQVAREPHLMIKGLSNYWGYSTLGFFAPHAGYATGGMGEQVVEFKEMVRRLHRAGIEVILDVVYNHTAEGGTLGPTLSLRGLDNRLFYRLRSNYPQRYENPTGCGNTLDFSQPLVRDLVLSSLRYWVEEMHVDGFRIDLATSLGRDRADPRRFDARGGLLQAMTEDPVLSTVKLIAEPWDIGEHGYQLGQFPASWGEWNDRFRDASRRFWRGDGNAVELASRIAGSGDLFPDRKHGSVNFVTCHDGFTLTDLASYEHKHNLANREDNRDGNNHNLSRNWGVEGPSDDLGVEAARLRARRNLMATLFLSRGVPMLLQGDELGHSQQGNNNAYCQDNETSWVDWVGADQEFLAFVQHLVELRRSYPKLGQGAETLRCWTPEGRRLETSAVPALAIELVGDDDRLLLLANGSDGEVVFHLSEQASDWTVEFDTTDPLSVGSGLWSLAAFSLRLLRH